MPSEREIRVQIREAPLFYVPNGFEINGPTKERDFHFNAGTTTKAHYSQIFHNKSDMFLIVYYLGASMNPLPAYPF